MSFADELQRYLNCGMTLQYREPVRIKKNGAFVQEDALSWKRFNGRRPISSQDLWGDRDFNVLI